MKYALIAVDAMDILAVGDEGHVLRKMLGFMNEPNRVQEAMGQRAARLTDFAIMAQENEDSQPEAIDPFVFITRVSVYLQDLALSRHKIKILTYGRLYGFIT